jgi:UDP:flavonoid glycosyltransferase YjiC (YdhE family)
VFPQLQLARYAQSQGMKQLRFYSCPKVRSDVESAGIHFQPVLADREEEILDMIGQHERVLDSYAALFSMADRALAVQEQFEQELRSYWKADPPDLVVIDFLSPFAGVIADELGIPWWTVVTSPTAIESPHGTPTYLGGLAPPRTIFGKCRDAMGRWFIRTLKKLAFFLYRKKIQPLGFTSVYREDGTERMYSNEVILGLGMSELEFEERDLPNAWHWIGPCLERPVLDHQSPEYEPEKKHILVAPGTQVRWARERAENMCREVAKHMPECVFHFALNVLSGYNLHAPRKENNLHVYGYIPFTPESFQNYDVVVNMGGIGVMYTAIAAGVPQLALPQSFEQQDCATRVLRSGVGLRSSGTLDNIVSEIKQLLEGEKYRNQANEYRQMTERYNPGKSFVELVQKKLAE